MSYRDLIDWMDRTRSLPFLSSRAVTLSFCLTSCFTSSLTSPYLPSFRPTFLPHPYFSTRCSPLNLDYTTTAITTSSSSWHPASVFTHIASTDGAAMISRGKEVRSMICRLTPAFLTSPSIHYTQYPTVQNLLNVLLSSFNLILWLRNKLNQLLWFFLPQHLSHLKDRIWRLSPIHCPLCTLNVLNFTILFLTICTCTVWHYATVHYAALHCFDAIFYHIITAMRRYENKLSLSLSLVRISSSVTRRSTYVRIMTVVL